MAEQKELTLIPAGDYEGVVSATFKCKFDERSFMYWIPFKVAIDGFETHAHTRLLTDNQVIAEALELGRETWVGRRVRVRVKHNVFKDRIYPVVLVQSFS